LHHRLDTSKFSKPVSLEWIIGYPCHNQGRQLGNNQAARTVIQKGNKGRKGSLLRKGRQKLSDTQPVSARVEPNNQRKWLTGTTVKLSAVGDWIMSLRERAPASTSLGS